MIVLPKKIENFSFLNFKLIWCSFIFKAIVGCHLRPSCHRLPTKNLNLQFNDANVNIFLNSGNGIRHQEMAL